MKKIILGAVIGITILATLSMTIDQAGATSRISGSSGVHLNVPAKPAATAYVMGTEKMYQYIKKGFQVQQVVGDPSHAATYHYFLMVKY
jgi:hypothetical protein